MAERKARFKFIIDRKIAIDTRRTLAHMASRHINDAVAYSNRAALRLAETLKWLRHIDRMETRILATETLDEEEEELEDQRLVREAITALEAAEKALHMLRLRKIDAATAFEDSIDPLFAPQPKPKKKKKKKSPLAEGDTPEQVEILPLVQRPVAAPAIQPIPDEEVAVMKPITLMLDPELLARARKELSARESQENDENGF